MAKKIMGEEIKICEYHKICKLYDKKCKTCNEDEAYYGAKLASCWIKIHDELMEKQKKK